MLWTEVITDNNPSVDSSASVTVISNLEAPYIHSENEEQFTTPLHSISWRDMGGQLQNGKEGKLVLSFGDVRNRAIELFNIWNSEITCSKAGLVAKRYRDLKAWW